MRKLFIPVLFSILLSSASVAQELPNADLLDRYSNKYTQKELSESNLFFLVISLGCGYCVRDIPYYNALAVKYSASSDVKFVVLLENNLHTINNYRGRDFFNDNWIVIPAAREYYSKIWRKSIFPEYIVYLNGKRDKSFAFSSTKTKSKIEDYLTDLTRKKSKK